MYLEKERGLIVLKRSVCVLREREGADLPQKKTEESRSACVLREREGADRSQQKCLCTEKKRGC